MLTLFCFSQSTNLGALALYEKLGFARDEKLARYYLNGGRYPKYIVSAWWISCHIVFIKKPCFRLCDKYVFWMKNNALTYLFTGDAYRLILWVQPNESDEINDLEGANIISTSESRWHCLAPIDFMSYLRTHNLFPFFTYSITSSLYGYTATVVPANYNDNVICGLM